MGTAVSNLGGRQQIWNLGNNIIDTSNLVNLELQALEMKKTPYNNQKQTLSNERNIYASMKKEFNSFVQVFKDMYAFKGNEKKTSVSKEGFVTAQADASAIAGTYNITVEKVAERHQITTRPVDLSDPKNPKNKIDLDAKLGKDVAFEINGKEVKISKDMTYKDMVNKINNGNYGVSVYSLGGQLFFTSTTAGEKGAINLVDGKEGFLEEIGLVNSSIDEDTNKKVFTIANEITAATNAEYTINGIKDSSTSNKIDTIPGLTINLEKATSEPIKITIEDSNVKDSIDLIKKMKDEYNKAVGNLDLFAGENGAMQGNNISFSLSNSMTSLFKHSQDNKYLFSFGIQVDKTGKMTLDEEKLKTAFKENPESAKQFFFGFNGVGHEMEKKLDSIFGDEGVIGKRSKSIEDQLKDIDKKIAAIDIMNKQKQEDIVNKYQKLESTLAELDSQLKTIKAMTKTKSDD
ncbi:flagellar hook-associated protein 2 [Bacillus paranthracis]|uniref:flagellar hook-associated protein 2 n=1 Tax=Bacillus cereus group TaxID=86661 RepID=UPI000C32CA96|nr:MULTISPECIES: flagellar hook-associated protein 2 [Bacillus cereus group]PKF96300.1 flagellar filament capping protein FliD [Bacillus cereus]MDA1590821.1 flagellar hook-associated protein 2 [Bacillus cereus group sp. TH225LC]MDA1890085.1 flagellar hook-associated protein 2 [Bacillus cereus group sp. BY11-1LC]MDA2590745.1 flagellar hook-associated protein 2 [Bacillus cereus group sp. Bc065]MDK7438976.1 flagellar hook-associated protein 2 [Bacillus paranthracis]